MHDSLFPAGICVGPLDEERWRHVSVHVPERVAPGWPGHASGVPWLYYSIAPCVWLVKLSSSHAGMLGKFGFKILTSLRRALGPFRNAHLSGWHHDIQRQVWSCSEMCLNLCHVLVWWVWNWSFSAFLYIYLLIAGDGASWLHGDHGLDPGKSCTSGEETCLLICFLCEKWQSGFDTCYIVNYWHMSCRISCTAGWHRTIVCAMTLYGILIATWLEILVLIEIAADVFQFSYSFLFNLRPSGASLCSASSPRAHSGNKTCTCVIPIWREKCPGLTQCLSCCPRPTCSLTTLRGIQLNTLTATYVNSKAATSKGFLAALDSFSHCAQIWIWLHCWRKLA